MQEKPTFVWEPIDWATKFAPYHPRRVKQWLQSSKTADKVAALLLLVVPLACIISVHARGYDATDTIVLFVMYVMIALVLPALGLTFTCIGWALDRLGLLKPLTQGLGFFKPLVQGLECAIEKTFKVVLWIAIAIAVVACAVFAFRWSSDALSDAMRSLSVPAAILIGALIIASSRR